MSERNKHGKRLDQIDKDKIEVGLPVISNRTDIPGTVICKDKSDPVGMFLVVKRSDGHFAMLCENNFDLEDWNYDLSKG